MELRLQLPTQDSQRSVASVASTEYYSPKGCFIAHEPTLALDLASMRTLDSFKSFEPSLKRKKRGGLARKLRRLGSRLCRTPKPVGEEGPETKKCLAVEAGKEASGKLGEPSLDMEIWEDAKEVAPRLEEVGSLGGDGEWQAFVERMNGKWQQNKAISDSTDELCRILNFGWVFKQALDKSDILQVHVDGTRVKQVAKLVRLVDLVEEFPLSGEEILLRRRDLRRGPLHGSTMLTNSGYKNSLWWDNPCKGGMTENLVFSNDGLHLEMKSDVWNQKGEKCILVTKWNRIE